MRWNSGWKLNQPPSSLPTWPRVLIASSWPMWIGLPAASAMQLRLAALVHAEEPERSGLHRVADGEQAVVAQDDGFALTEHRADAVAFRGVEHYAVVVLEDGVVFVEGARVLRDRVELLAERREACGRTSSGCARPR